MLVLIQMVLVVFPVYVFHSYSDFLLVMISFLTSLSALLFRHSAGKHASILHDLKLSDFDPKEKFWTRFPAEGSKITPPHQSVEFRWKDYCPVVFR